MTAKTQYRNIKVGDLVKLKNQIQTRGGMIFGKGLVLKVFKKYRGLGLRTINNKPCKECKIGRIHQIEEVPVTNVTRIEPKRKGRPSTRLWNHERAGLG